MENDKSDLLPDTLESLKMEDLVSVNAKMWVSNEMRTHRSVDLDEGDVGFLVHIFDFSVVCGSRLQLHFDSMLVGHHVSVGDDQTVFWYNEAWAASHSHLALGEHHPAT